MNFKNGLVALVALVGFSGACAQIVQKKYKVINRSERHVTFVVMTPKGAQDEAINDWHRTDVYVPANEKGKEVVKEGFFTFDDNYDELYRCIDKGYFSAPQIALHTTGSADGVTCVFDEQDKMKCHLLVSGS